MVRMEHEWCLRKCVRVNRREEGELEDLDWRGWKILKGIYVSWSLKDGDKRQQTEEKGRLKVLKRP